MAKKSKFAFNFKAMEELAANIEAAGGDLQKAADSALKATHGLITPKLGSNIKRHHATGDTEESLERSPRVEWPTPLKAQINIGFDLEDGGWPSIFLMWGTPKRATEMPVDMALRDAAFSPKLKREVAKIQREALEKVLQRLTRG